MVRLQIQLTESQHLRLVSHAKAHGLSLAEEIRRCVDSQLASQQATPKERWRKLLAVSGKYRDDSGDTRVAEHHDKALAEILSP